MLPLNVQRGKQNKIIYMGVGLQTGPHTRRAGSDGRMRQTTPDR